MRRAKDRADEELCGDDRLYLAVAPLHADVNVVRSACHNDGYSLQEGAKLL